MTVTTLTSRGFNRDTSGAKRTAEHGPVFMTNRGKPTHVLLTIEAYQRLTGERLSLLAALAEPGPDFKFKPPRFGDKIIPAADLS